MEVTSAPRLMSHRARSSSPDAHARCSAVRPSGSDAEVTSKKPASPDPRDDARFTAFLQPRRLPLAAARRNLRSYFARLLFALVPPEDEDEDGDEEGIRCPSKWREAPPNLTFRK